MKKSYLRVVAKSTASCLLACVATAYWSCTPPKKTVEVRAQPIPPLHAKIYESPDVDWAANQRLKLELRQVGKPDTASNQILERYLLKQISDCFNRKGYVFDDSNYYATVRVYFGVKEEKLLSSNTLTYGLSGGSSSGVFFENYNLGSCTWKTAGLAVTAWSTRTVEEAIPIYDGEITVEIFDRIGTTQLWRGDIRSPLATDDIRIASNQMIREVLWYLPALDYPAVAVPSVPPEEFDRFWKNFVEDYEFYSPGQRYPVSLNYAYYPTGKQLREGVSPKQRNEKALREAALEFEKTDEHRAARKKFKGTAWGDPFETSTLYDRVFRDFVYNVWNPRWAKAEFAPFARCGVAIADLLMTAPWAIEDQEGHSIYVAGRYIIGDDIEPTFVMIRATPMTYRVLETTNVNYEYRRYFISKIAVISADEFKDAWQESREYRDMVFGRQIDRIPPEPTPTVVAQQG